MLSALINLTWIFAACAFTGLIAYAVFSTVRFVARGCVRGLLVRLAGIAPDPARDHARRLKLLARVIE